MDWKEAVCDYFWKLETAIGNDTKLTLPALDKYPGVASLHFGSVLTDAVAALDAAGYKQIFINDLSDSHNAILVKGEDVVQAVTALENLHLDYNINFPA